MQLEAALGDGPYFAGESFSTVDAVVGRRGCASELSQSAWRIPARARLGTVATHDSYQHGKEVEKWRGSETLG